MPVTNTVDTALGEATEERTIDAWVPNGEACGARALGREPRVEGGKLDMSSLCP